MTIVNPSAASAAPYRTIAVGPTTAATRSVAKRPTVIATANAPYA
jgi:hypothetical protein